jgi:hypothetical protein
VTSVDQLVEDLIQYYVRLNRGERPDLDVDWDVDTPWEVLRKLAQQDDPERAWAITKELLSTAPDFALGYVAAGPLEDLISFHGPGFIDRFEAYASRNARLAAALESVVVDRWVSEEVCERLRKICPTLRVDGPA